MLRGIMAVSRDGFVCSGPDDNMRWTGASDKALFRSQTDGCVIGAGTTTWEGMKNLKLPNRTLVRITRDPAPLFQETEMTLGEFAERHPDGWLIGGQTVLLAAIREGLVDRVLLSHVRAELKAGEKDGVSGVLHEMGWHPRVYPQDDLQIVTWNQTRGS